MGKAESAPRPTDEVFAEYWARRDAARSWLPVGPAAAAVALLRSLRPIFRAWLMAPRHTIRVSSSLDGQLVASRLAYRLAGRWVARPLFTVIELPESMETYMTGPSAKSRRGNLNRAHKLGITHAPLPAGAQANELYAHCNNGRDLAADGVDTAVAAPGTITLMALDKDGEAIAVGVVVVDREDAYLSHLVAISGREDTLPARWLVHTELLRLLIERGARRLWSEGPLVATMGNQMFQMRLGYTVARARVIADA